MVKTSGPGTREPGPGKNKPRLAGLYVVTDERLGSRLEAVVEAALAGGARIVQYRDKGSDSAKRRRQARALRRLTRDYAALFIVNDDPSLAADSEADGVHLGRDDTGLAAARGLLGPNTLIGVSCYGSLQRAGDAVAAGADYVAFGSVFPSPVKPDAERAPLALFAQAGREIEVPLCAIGGITPDNAPRLLEAGADMLAVVSAVVFAGDPNRAARRFAGLFEHDRQADGFGRPLFRRGRSG